MTLLQEALAPRSDQLNADDLIAGPRTLTITGARFVQGDRGGKKIVISYDGDGGKPFKPCKTMGRAMVMVWGIVDDPDESKVSAQFAGKSITVYRDPEVKFGDQGAVGGIRISHMSHIDSPKTVKLTVSQGKKSNFVFKPLTTPKLAARQTPDEWLANYKGAVETAPDLDALAAVQQKATRALDKLKVDHPALYDAAVQAGKDRADALNPSEGRATEDMGEGHVEEAQEEAPF